MMTMIILCNQTLTNSLEAKDWITIISVLIVVIGWFVHALLNRRHEISKERFKYQMVARQSFINVWLLIQKNSAPFTNPLFLPLLEEARKNFQLYGTEIEIKLLEQFINNCEAQNVPGANKALAELVTLIRTKIRSELNI